MSRKGRIGGIWKNFFLLAMISMAKIYSKRVSFLWFINWSRRMCYFRSRQFLIGNCKTNLHRGIKMKLSNYSVWSTCVILNLYSNCDLKSSLSTEHRVMNPTYRWMFSATKKIREYSKKIESKSFWRNITCELFESICIMHPIKNLLMNKPQQQRRQQQQ